MRPPPTWNRDEIGHFDALVPDAPWFWGSLSSECVSECCGLAAYDFSPESVRWVCHLTEDNPGRTIDWRPEVVGDCKQLAIDLHSSAIEIRAMPDDAVSANLFNEILVPSSYADLFDELASIIESGLA